MRTATFQQLLQWRRMLIAKLRNMDIVSFKGENFVQDVILVRPRCSFPKGMGGGRLVGSDKFISDSASSVHAHSGALQASIANQDSTKGTQSTSRRNLKT